MANRYHNPEHQKNGPPSPGLAARVQQLAEVRQDVGMVAESNRVTDMATTGNVDTARRVRVAQRALRRQQQFAAGQYPSGR